MYLYSPNIHLYFSKFLQVGIDMKSFYGKGEIYLCVCVCVCV